MSMGDDSCPLGLAQEQRILSHRVDSLEGSVREIRDSIRSIEGYMAVLTRVETRHESILDSNTRLIARQDTLADAQEATARGLAVNDATTSRHEKLIWTVVAATIVQAIGAISKAIGG